MLGLTKARDGGVSGQRTADGSTSEPGVGLLRAGETGHVGQAGPGGQHMMTEGVAAKGDADKLTIGHVNELMRRALLAQGQTWEELYGKQLGETSSQVQVGKS